MIRTALPQRHWARGMTAVSSMWGIGLLIGPALGGLFAGLGLWRGAYGLLTVASVGLAVAAGRPSPASAGRGSIARCPWFRCWRSLRPWRSSAWPVWSAPAGPC